MCALKGLRKHVFQVTVSEEGVYSAKMICSRALGQMNGSLFAAFILQGGGHEFQG
jgi:hypothetical protein